MNALRTFVLVAVTAGLCVAADPTGESLLQRYIDRSGGAAAYAKAKNMAMSGTVEMPAQNITGNGVYRHRQDRRRIRRRYRLAEQRAAGPARSGRRGKSLSQTRRDTLNDYFVARGL